MGKTQLGHRGVRNLQSDGVGIFFTLEVAGMRGFCEPRDRVLLNIDCGECLQ